LLHELYNKRRLISLYILPFLIGSWLTLVCQGCFAMDAIDVDSLDGQATYIGVVQSDQAYLSHCNGGMESGIQDSDDGLGFSEGMQATDIQCQQLMLAETLITDDVVSPLVEIADYSSPVLVYSYTDLEIHFSPSSFTVESVHARSDLYIPEKNRILLI